MIKGNFERVGGWGECREFARARGCVCLCVCACVLRFGVFRRLLGRPLGGALFFFLMLLLGVVKVGWEV